MITFMHDCEEFIHSLTLELMKRKQERQILPD
jgi:hypothetical protein